MEYMKFKKMLINKCFFSEVFISKVNRKGKEKQEIELFNYRFQFSTYH